MHILVGISSTKYLNSFYSDFNGAILWSRVCTYLAPKYGIFIIFKLNIIKIHTLCHNLAPGMYIPGAKVCVSTYMVSGCSLYMVGEFRYNGARVLLALERVLLCM